MARSLGRLRQRPRPNRLPFSSNGAGLLVRDFTLSGVGAMNMKMTRLLGVLTLFCGLCQMMQLVLADLGPQCLVECYQGNCITGNTCQCKAGWSNLLGWSALPCLIPTCNLDISCSAPQASTPSPPPPPVVPSVFCPFIDCGAGTCEAGGFPWPVIGYQCACNPGYGNLFNYTAAPCVEECAVTAGCKSINVPIGASPPASNSQGNITPVTDQPPSPTSSVGPGCKSAGNTLVVRLSGSLILAIASLAVLI